MPVQLLTNFKTAHQGRTYHQLPSSSIIPGVDRISVSIVQMHRTRVHELRVKDRRHPFSKQHKMVDEILWEAAMVEQSRSKMPKESIMLHGIGEMLRDFIGDSRNDSGKQLTRRQVDISHSVFARQSVQSPNTRLAHSKRHFESLDTGQQCQLHERQAV